LKRWRRGCDPHPRHFFALLILRVFLAWIEIPIRIDPNQLIFALRLLAEIKRAAPLKSTWSAVVAISIALLQSHFRRLAWTRLHIAPHRAPHLAW